MLKFLETMEQELDPSLNKKDLVLHCIDKLTEEEAAMELFFLQHGRMSNRFTATRISVELNKECLESIEGNWAPEKLIRKYRQENAEEVESNSEPDDVSHEQQSVGSQSADHQQVLDNLKKLHIDNSAFIADVQRQAEAQQQAIQLQLQRHQEAMQLQINILMETQRQQAEMFKSMMMQRSPNPSPLKAAPKANMATALKATMAPTLVRSGNPPPGFSRSGNPTPSFGRAGSSTPPPPSPKSILAPTQRKSNTEGVMDKRIDELAAQLASRVWGPNALQKYTIWGLQVGVTGLEQELENLEVRQNQLFEELVKIYNKRGNRAQAEQDASALIQEYQQLHPESRGRIPADFEDAGEFQLEAFRS
jgi:hypothetical protein